MTTAAIDIRVREGKEPAAAHPPVTVLSTAELAECTCPDWCERDHDRD
ncbi:MAG: hypothetical protein ACRDON_01260 [Gaiellaceae bacterium]